MNIKEIVSKMTLEEKIKFCTGKDCWHIHAQAQSKHRLCLDHPRLPDCNARYAASDQAG